MLQNENQRILISSNDIKPYADIKKTEAATRDVLCKKVFLEISQNSQENTCTRVWTQTLAQVFSSEFREIFTNTFFKEQLREPASDYNCSQNPYLFKTIGTKYSREDQIKFVGDSLWENLLDPLLNTLSQLLLLIENDRVLNMKWHLCKDFS